MFILYMEFRFTPIFRLQPLNPLRVNSGKLATVQCSDICVILINFIYTYPKVFHIFFFSSATTILQQSVGQINLLVANCS